MPVKLLRYSAGTAERVFPSPVFCSAIFPVARTDAAISCTSKCLSPVVRREASRTKANASGIMLSIVSPSVILFLNSSVFAGKSFSLYFLTVSSRLLIFSITGFSLVISFSLESKMRLRIFSIRSYYTIF